MADLSAGLIDERWRACGAPSRGREHLLRRHGRRLEVRARRRGGGLTITFIKYRRHQIGVAQKALTSRLLGGDATYTVLTVGDGLVTRSPAGVSSPRDAVANAGISARWTRRIGQFERLPGGARPRLRSSPCRFAIRPGIPLCRSWRSRADRGAAWH